MVDDADDQEIILFRGQSEGWPLLPKIARQTVRHGDVLTTERDLLSHFRRVSLPHFHGAHKPWNELELMCIAQHHGLPTRLLDWSRNPLAALWFVVCRPPVGNEDGVLWMYKPTDADHLKPGAVSSPLEVTQTGVIVPDHITPRLVAQAGAFTLHAHFQNHGGFVPFESNVLRGGALTSLTVRRERFSDLRYALDRVGINHATMFPDLEGTAQHVAWLYTRFSDEDIASSSRVNALRRA